MEISNDHKSLLKALGLQEKDFQHFDGKIVSYEYDEEKGVRLYDPYYRTSYSEYIGIDGWSSWSSEGDRFMSAILKDARKKAEAMEKNSPGLSPEDLEREIRKRFGEKPSPEPEK